MHTTMVSEQVKTMKIQAGTQVSRSEELRRHLQLWKRFESALFMLYLYLLGTLDFVRDAKGDEFIGRGGWWWWEIAEHVVVKRATPEFRQQEFAEPRVSLEKACSDNNDVYKVCILVYYHQNKWLKPAFLCADNNDMYNNMKVLVELINIFVEC
nr:hypothetical protein [Tanacetum cinerariifolium]